jgi:hypothetical protein
VEFQIGDEKDSDRKFLFIGGAGEKLENVYLISSRFISYVESLVTIGSQTMSTLYRVTTYDCISRASGSPVQR